MEDLVVSLETARKLKAAGFDQDTRFTWQQGRPLAAGNFHLRVGDGAEDAGHVDQGERYAAPTAEEIASRLPDDGFALLRLPRATSPRYRSNSFTRSCEADTMAEALAGLYLKQHLTPDEGSPQGG
ncbi:MAG TPA: hypothetical protein VMT69_08025 [Kineosporiaceae bacterium]|nr:hypothetical protein [Kineosporiaceae bacterium]